MDIAEYHALFCYRQADPVRFNNRLEIDCVYTNSNYIRNDNTYKNGNDFEHSFAPDIADNDNGESNNCKEPVLFTVINGRACKAETYCDNNGACYYRREEAHYFFYREYSEKCGEHKINKTCAHNAQICIRQHFGIRGAVLKKRSHNGISAEEREG